MGHTEELHLQNCTFNFAKVDYSVGENVEVQREFKKSDGSEIRWWFLIRGDESVLQTFQMEWEKVEYSTSWKLELCHRPIPPTPEQLSQSNGVTKNQERMDRKRLM